MSVWVAGTQQASEGPSVCACFWLCGEARLHLFVLLLPVFPTFLLQHLQMTEWWNEAFVSSGNKGQEGNAGGDTP